VTLGDGAGVGAAGADVTAGSEDEAGVGAVLAVLPSANLSCGGPLNKLSEGELEGATGTGGGGSGADANAIVSLGATGALDEAALSFSVQTGVTNDPYGLTGPWGEGNVPARTQSGKPSTAKAEILKMVDADFMVVSKISPEPERE